jgi:hypothetical protein
MGIELGPSLLALSGLGCVSIKIPLIPTAIAALAKTGTISDMQNVVDKAFEVGNEKITICDRGTSFGYNTHSIQKTQHQLYSFKIQQ